MHHLATLVSTYPPFKGPLLTSTGLLRSTCCPGASATDQKRLAFAVGAGQGSLCRLSEGMFQSGHRKLRGSTATEGWT
eukprot:4524667-Amphidinium_carterae.1